MAEWAVVLVPFIRSCLDTNMFNSILIRVKITIFYNCVLDIREVRFNFDDCYQSLLRQIQSVGCDVSTGIDGRIEIQKREVV